MPLSRRIVIAIIVCLVFSLFGIIADTPAQTPHSDRDLFDFPDATDLYCVYHPSSSQAIALVPAEGTASMVFELTAFEDVTLASLTTQDWQTPDLLEVFPGDTVVLRTTDDILYKLTFPAPPHAEAPQLTLHYALLTEDAAIQPQIVAIAYDEALDLDTGDTFLDPTVAAVVFCDVGPIVPTPTPPTPIPEPGSALLVVLGLTGLYVAWKLAQRKGKRSIGLWIVILFSAFVLVSPGVKWLTAQSNLTCTLMVKRDGSGSGLVRGGEIDCGESCRVSHGNGELLHLKAIPDEGSTFSGWLVNGDPSTGLIFMHGDTVLTALFGAVATPTATPTPTPSPSNRAPQAVNDAYTTDEDRLLRVSAPGVLRNDRDPNDDPLQAVLVRPPLTRRADPERRRLVYLYAQCPFCRD